MTDPRDAIRELLPHRSFELAATYRGALGIGTDIMLLVRCSCGRTLEWPAGGRNALRMDILLWWLLDHDDDMFLTPAQLDAKHNATIERAPVFARDIASPPYEAAHDSTWNAVRASYNEAHTNTTQAAHDIGETP